MIAGYMDFYSDQGAFLVKLLHSTPVPDFVKTSQYETEESVNGLPASAFANQAERTFPIHTPVDVYMSAAYLHGKQAAFQPEIADGILKAAHVFGIEKDVQEVITKATEYRTRQSKTAAPVGQWQFATKSARWAGRGQEHLNEAAGRLEKNFAAYEFSERTEIAQNLMKVATDLGVEAPEAIQKFAGLSHVDLDLMEIELQARALSLQEGRDTRNFLGKIAELRDAADATPEEAMKVAEFLAEFDRQANITHLYGSRFSDPHSAVFNTPRSEFEDKVATVQIGDVKHRLLDLRSCPQDVFAEILGDKVANHRELANLDPEKARLLNQVLA